MTCTDNSNIVSADATNLIYFPYTGPTASGPGTSYQTEKIGTFKFTKAGSVPSWMPGKGEPAEDRDYEDAGGRSRETPKRQN